MIICVLHYVDDFGGVQDSYNSQSSFQSFSDFCTLLGYRLKPSKAQPQVTEQRLLGVIIQVAEQGIRVRADPKRVSKLRSQLVEILEDGHREPEVASKLAGKLGFVNSTAFGRTGEAALRPLHARASCT